MIGDNRPTRLAGIRPAPLCREAENRSKKLMKASSLPSLARLGMFKASNDAKSRFIHKHMREATALAQASMEAGDCTGGGAIPRHWGGPPEFPLAKVSEPLAVMATEAALEDFKRRQRDQRHDVHNSNGRETNGNALRQSQRLGASTPRPMRRTRQRLPRNGKPNHHDHRHHQHQHQHRNQHRPRQDNPYDHLYDHHDHQGQHGNQPQGLYSQLRPFQRQEYRPPSTHAVVLPQGKGLVLIGEDGVRKSKFPRGCDVNSSGAPGVRASTAVPSASKGGGGIENDDVLTRLCNPKLFTGTAATGHLPQVVDLEGGAGVLLKGASITVKDHIGAQEVSWRLRLAERL